MFNVILILIYIIYILIIYKIQNKKILELSERVVDLEIENSENKLVILKLENKIDVNKID